MKKILTNEQLKELEKFIQEQARIRSIPTIVTLTEGVNRLKQPKLILKSTPFNTVPVIHSEIILDDFGSRIKKDEKNDNITNIFIRVHASYEGNGVELFVVSGSFFESEARFYKD